MSEIHFDEEKVRQTYATVWKCFRAYEEYKEINAEFGRKHVSDAAPGRILPPKNLVRRLAELAEEFREAGQNAKGGVDGLVWHAPALRREPVKFGFVTASSWAQAMVLLVLALGERSKRWASFTNADEDTKRYLLNVLQSAPPTVDLLKANLEIEAARLRDRARSFGVYERYGSLLVELSEQSRELFVLLAENEGWVVVYDRIHQRLWPDAQLEPTQAASRRTTAMKKLRDELRKAKEHSLRARLQTRKGRGYILVRP